MYREQANAEINMSNLHSNIKQIRKQISKETKLAVVVKADAYGHGNLRIVEEVVTHQLADMVIVGKLEEASIVKTVSGELPLLILGNVLLEQIEQAMDDKYIFSVYSFEYLRRMNQLSKKWRTKFHVHIRIDVHGNGMGVSLEEFKEHQKEIFHMSGVCVEGIYSHLYSGYSFDKALIQSELEKFDKLIRGVPSEQRESLLVHIESSPLIFMFPEYHYDMVRSGTAVYGLPCSKENHSLRPLLSLKAYIFQISGHLQSGQMMNYSVKAGLDGGVRKIAQVMFGYWDCPFLMTSQNVKVLIRGKLYDVLEEPCMDNACIDITGSEDICVGDEVCFLGEEDGVTLPEVLQRGNINLEHSERVCMVAARMTKKYVYSGEHFVSLLTKQIYEEAPLLKAMDEENGDLSLADYLDGVTPACCESILPCKDVCDAVYDYLLPLVGQKVAHETAEQIGEQKLLLTANHHEVEYCVQSVQGNVLYDAMLRRKGLSGDIVPILSNTTVNMSNANFPRGMLIYDTREELVKIPVFPFKMRNSVVAAAEPFTQSMVEQAEKTLKKEFTCGNLQENTYVTAHHILHDYYMNENVLAANRYGEQALMVNRLIGKEMYHSDKKEILYIELEEVSRRLLAKDMQSEETLTYQILFDPSMRNAILRELEKKDGCWDTETLMSGEHPNGTHFFWGVDARKRRFPLCLVQEKDETRLQGIDMGGETHHIVWSEKTLIRAMEQGELIPGLFLSFLELHLLRDFTLLGGCFQSLYLQSMNEGIRRAIGSGEKLGDIQESLKNKINYYLSGPVVALAGENGIRFPMSTVELLEQGGVSESLVTEFMDVSLKEANRRGVFTFYGDLVRGDRRWTDWWIKLKRAYGGQVVE